MGQMKRVAISATDRAHAEQQAITHCRVKELHGVRRDRREAPRNGWATYIADFEEKDDV